MKHYRPYTPHEAAWKLMAVAYNRGLTANVTNQTVRRILYTCPVFPDNWMVCRNLWTSNPQTAVQA
jgi:hypothetical protein